MSIRVLLSVELCVTLKTYLKGAPFYNASCSRKCAAAECCSRSDLLEARRVFTIRFPARHLNCQQNKALNALSPPPPLTCASLVASWLSSQHELGVQPGKDHCNVWTNDG